MTEELIRPDHGYTKLQLADALQLIEALQEQLTTEHLNCAMADAAVAKLAARVAELKKLEAALKDGLAGACIERDALAAELAAARAVIKRVQRIALIDPPHTGQMLEIAAVIAAEATK